MTWKGIGAGRSVLGETSGFTKNTKVNTLQNLKKNLPNMTSGDRRIGGGGEHLRHPCAPEFFFANKKLH
jgi:hypothetical protein